MTIPDRVLRQYLAGALEPPDLERVEIALAGSPALRERRDLLLADTVEVAPQLGSGRIGLGGRWGGAGDGPGGWIIPPPSVPPPDRGFALSGVAAPVATMGGERGGGLDAGWVVLRLEVAPEHLDHRIVVLERSGAQWRVLSPEGPDDFRRASELVRDDRVRIDLATDADAHRIAVVLVPGGWSIAFDEPPDRRWSRIQGALIAGEIPVISFDMRD